MFRFTIRDVLWLMVVVGLGCAWFITLRGASVLQARQEAEQERLRAESAKKEFDAKLAITKLEYRLESEKQKRKDAEDMLSTRPYYRFPIYFPELNQ